VDAVAFVVVSMGLIIRIWRWGVFEPNEVIRFGSTFYCGIGGAFKGIK